jgi:hypothetical protein
MKLLPTISIVTTLALFTLFQPTPSYAANSWSGCIKDGDVATIGCFSTVFQNVLTAILPLMGIAAFIVILYGGFQILISQGDPKKTEQGQKTLTYAVLGLVSIFLVWFLLLFISEVFLGKGITDSPLFQFNLFFPDP